MKISRHDIRVFWKETLPDYFLELLHYVWVVLIGAILAGAGAVINMGDLDVPSWVWWALIIVSIFIAQFLTWDSARNERDKLRRLNVTQDRVAQLQTYRQQLVTIQNNNVTSEVEYGAWRQKYDTLREEIVSYLENNFPLGESQSFSRFGDYQTVVLTGKNYVSPEHINFTARVIRDHRWLDRAFQDYGRRRLRPAEVEEA